MSTRSDRAQDRRLRWTGEVVRSGVPKGALYEGLSPAERWAALIELNERAWLAAGHALPAPQPRSQWPSEVFESGSNG